MKDKNKQLRFNTNAGFTLIETIMYIGIFTIIMTGAIVAIYGIIGQTTRNATKAMVQEEGSFLLGKIDWALSAAKEVSVSGDNNTLNVPQFDGSTLEIKIIGENMTIQKDATAPEKLNNTNTTITCPGSCFTYTTSSGDGVNPASIKANIIVNSKTSEGLFYSQEFSTIKYLRK